jgi:hypothetical protein
MQAASKDTVPLSTGSEPAAPTQPATSPFSAAPADLAPAGGASPHKHRHGARHPSGAEEDWELSSEEERELQTRGGAARRGKAAAGGVMTDVPGRGSGARGGARGLAETLSLDLVHWRQDVMATRTAATLVLVTLLGECPHSPTGLCSNTRPSLIPPAHRPPLSLPPRSFETPPPGSLLLPPRPGRPALARRGRDPPHQRLRQRRPVCRYDGRGAGDGCGGAADDAGDAVGEQGARVFGAGVWRACLARVFGACVWRVCVQRV